MTDLPPYEEIGVPPLHQIAHLEIRTPVLDRSVEFFTRYLGLTENGSAGDSVFLRAWDDYENVTVKLTAHATSGGNRIELCNAGVRLVLAPDWRTVDWAEAERAKGQAWA